MNFEKFIKHFLSKQQDYKREITNDFPWEIYKRVVNYLSKGDYGCQFKNGLCWRKRIYALNYHSGDNEYDKYIRKCCCSDCYSNVGYLGILPSNYETLKVYARLFSEKDRQGFHRDGKGCALPRELRSPTCIGYNCLTGLVREVGYKYNKDKVKMVKNEKNFLILCKFLSIRRDVGFGKFMEDILKSQEIHPEGVYVYNMLYSTKSEKKFIDTLVQQILKKESSYDTTIDKRLIKGG